MKLQAAARLTAMSPLLEDSIVAFLRSKGIVEDPALSSSRGFYFITAFKASKALAQKGFTVQAELHVDADNPDVKYTLSLDVNDGSRTVLKQVYRNLTLKDLPEVYKSIEKSLG